MNPLRYSLAEVQKALISILFLVGYLVLLFVNYNPHLLEAITLVVPPVFAVIGVFAAKHHSTDDLQKALMQAVFAVITVVNYFHTVPAGTTNKIVLAVGALVSVVSVYWTRNSRPVNAT